MTAPADPTDDPAAAGPVGGTATDGSVAGATAALQPAAGGMTSGGTASGGKATGGKATGGTASGGKATAGTAADGTAPAAHGGLHLVPAALDRLMPLHLWVCPGGTIRAAGPTLSKLFADGPLPGRPLLEVFALQRPPGITDVARLPALTGARLKLAMRQPPHTAFKGHAVALEGGAGWLLNLSFGIDVAEAVRDHRLTDADFAATDLTVEMLYLIEAKTAVLDELRRLNLRLQTAKSAAEEQALTDTLTGLRNRRALDLALAEAVAAASRFGLMNVDLDYFKAVNDRLGHAAGDHVLAHVAAILKEETRAGDTVARTGGDEFVLLFPGLSDPALLERIAARILARIERPIPYGEEDCRVSASIGITVASAPTQDLDRLLVEADRALYASKRAGRGRITRFTPALSEDGEAS